MSTMNFKGPGFKMQVPTDWLITSTPQIQAMFVSPPRRGGRSNFMVTLRRLEEDVTLEQVAQSSLETQQKEYDQFKLQKESVIIKGNVSGRQRWYTWFSKEHNVKIQQHQVIFLSNKLLTTLTTTRPDEKGMDEMAATLEQMVESFLFE